MVSTIDSPSSGEIFINGTNPFQLSSEELALFRRKQLGFVFQSFNLLSTLTVKENIVLPMTFRWCFRARNEQAIGRDCRELNITDILNKRTFEISGDKLKEQQSLVQLFISRNYYLQMNQQGTWTLNLQMM